MSIDYSEVIREGHVELPTKFKSFLESEVDSWKASVVSHLWYDHAFRLLKRHFTLNSSYWKSTMKSPCGFLCLMMPWSRSA